MAGKGDWAENATLDWLLGGSSPTRPTARYIAFHTADPTDVGTTGEQTTNGFTRTAITFGAASGGSSANTSTVDLTISGGSTAITHWSIWDASSGGNLIFTGAATTGRTYATGDHLTVAAGAITCTED
jgi:hypothetical protein